MFFNGQTLDYKLGAELYAYGDYKVVIRDLAGNYTEYLFTIQYAMNGGAVVLVIILMLGAAGAAVSVILSKKRVYQKRKHTQKTMTLSVSESENQCEAPNETNKTEPEESTDAKDRVESENEGKT